ncbi:disease resistance RPP13-like protein 1 [Artemisia annua]|uniref:Disease resistance RPP13-like protein 1 n=1 Tax=Artemisia annua TaxID=35608 RepID=A0A2U1LXU6_ARTAN|nr:disease resistance RPP13-like protein 1 [Artemisia annua]
MIDAFVTVAAEVILEKAFSLAANEFAIARGFTDSLKNLHNKLEMIRAKLRDAERQKGSEAVTVWLKQLKTVMSEADDLLDEVEYEVLRREVKKRDHTTRKIRCRPSLKKFSFRREMGHKIENIITKLSEINKHALELGLQVEQQIPIPNSLRNETHSYLDEFKIVGRENDKLQIIELLTESTKEEKLTIIPVVGMGGIGKTTLAKSVYNNPKIQRHFDVKAWVCVSLKVNINRLLEMIYESLNGQKCELPTRENLITKLREELGSKRYLLVLDDVWDEERTYWDDFRSCVVNMNSQNGNGIIVTTRKLEIGTNYMKKNSLTLQGLSDDEGWIMFKERANPLPELEEIGRDVVKKCHGLPLLVKVIGSMLQNYSGDKDKWLSVQESMVWGKEEGDMVLSILKLSFDNLPNSISKQCFAYCSIFEKDTVMKKEELIQLWMALGLLQADGTRNSNMEDVGNDIFKILRTYWDDFRSCVVNMNSQNGNGIIVTTRKLEIGTNYMKKNSLTLQGLSDDEGWIMFKERANPLPELEEIGRDVVKKCHGLPLLVKVIGSMLQNYSGDKDKWLSVQESMVWGEEEGDMVLSILKLSFDNLPNSISKQCFAYCSIFEKDTVMKKEELIQLWMALGLLQADGTRNSNMEDVGNDIFKILHLSITQEKDSNSFSYKFIKEAGSRSLHTLFMSSMGKEISFQDFKCLRILKLTYIRQKRIDESLGDLVHLRYLDLSDIFRIVFPKSISKLHHLQTLKLGSYSNSKKFPEGMRNLISLQHLESKHFVRSPKDVGQLTSLRTLSYFSVGRTKGYQIDELGRLKHLGGKLDISNLEEVRSKEEAIQADLGGKRNLYKINFSWNKSYEGVRQKDKDILEGLQTHENVKSLTIENYSSDCFPEWVMKMSTNTRGEWIHLDKLVDVTLSGCHNVLSLPMVLKLPLLRDLVLKDMDSLTSLSSSVGLGSSEPLSRSLRKLEVDGMKRLEKWTDAATNSSTMISPVLEMLSIEDCPKIILLDEHYPHPLVRLEIMNCKNLESIGSLQGLTSLESLVIWECPALLGIPDLHNLGGSLKKLKIMWCEKLTSVPSGIDSLTLLDYLWLGPFSEELDGFPSLKGIEKMRSNLRSLELIGWSDWESIPEEVKHLTSLEIFGICEFGIREIPMWLTNMSSIKRISFYNCHGLDADSVLKGAPREAEYVDINGKIIINRRSSS